MDENPKEKHAVSGFWAGGKTQPPLWGMPLMGSAENATMRNPTVAILAVPIIFTVGSVLHAFWTEPVKGGGRRRIL